MERIINQLEQRSYNMHKYPLNICIIDHEGTVAPDIIKNGTVLKYKYRDGEIANLVAEVMNASAIYMIPPDGQTYGMTLPDGTLTGCLVFTETNYADLIGNAWPITSKNTYTSTLIVVGNEKLGCIAPKQLEFTKLLYTSIFDGWVFVIIFFSHLSTVFTLFLTDRFYNSKFNWKMFLDYYFITIASMFMVSQNSNSVNSYKVLLIFWIIFSMINCITYQAKIVQSLTTSKTSKDINTMQDLADSGLKLVIKPGFGEIINYLVDSEEHPEIYEILKSRLAEFPDSIDTFSKVYKDKNSVMFCSMVECELLKLTYFSNETGQELLHVFREQFGEMHHAQASHIRSPFRKRFIDIIPKICESGFITRWDNLEYHRLKLWSTKRRHEFLKDTSNNVFSMHELKFIFRSIGYAWIAAGVLFISELFWKSIQ
uniref:Putative glutamate-gated kainate-type ion channel receptor subunit glur5 n=1 Tax=Xenopsylla cheopis TaxID=163159 RepID=A0A6M2DM18_XENCH